MNKLSTSARGLTRRLVLPLLVGLMTSSGLAQQTFYNMTTANYSQDFADIANWGNSYASGVGANNWRVATSVATSPLTNATVFTTGVSGGVQKSTASMVLLATGTNAGGTDLLLNFSGRLAGNFSFNWSKVANTANNANPRTSDLKLQFSLDNGTTFTDLTGYSTPRISNTDVAETGSITFQLPSAINNQSQVVIRFYFWNNGQISGTGSRPKWDVDNIAVTSTPAAQGVPIITSGTTASVTAFTPTASIYQITASNSPESFNATGLPSGLSIDPATGIISGTATEPGTYSVGLAATNPQGTGGAILTLTVNKNPGAPTISSALTASGAVGTPFTYQIVADNSPTSYSSGPLPSGLTLDTSSGLISGTPTTGGSPSVAITASNALGSDTKTLVITLVSPPVITSPTSGSLYATNNFGYTITADFSPTSFGASNLPSGWSVTSTNGAITNGTTPLTTGAISFGISASNTNGTGTATYTLKVFNQAMQDAVPLNVVVNKYVNAAVDKVQLLVVGDGTPGSTVDMRGMIIKDFSSSMGTDNGGKYIFASSAIWSAVPAGTLIVLSAGTTQTEDIDSSDFYLAVNLGNTTYFTNGGGSFDIATTDMLMIKQAGSGVSGVAGGIHVLAGGTAGALFNAFTGAKLRATGTSGTDFGVIANNSTSQLSDYGTSGGTASADATGGQAAASLNFASWNNGTNENYVKVLRGILDGTGSAAVTNDDFSSDFYSVNIFDKSQTGQTIRIAYAPSSPQTPITGLSVVVPTEFGAPVADNVSIEGTGAEAATKEISGQTITISGLNALVPDSIFVVIAGLSTPDTASSVTNSGLYTFTMQSKGQDGTLTPLSNSPFARVVIPIANARNADPTTFVPTLLGQSVAVEGVASVSKLGSGALNSALQDATHGITVYSGSVSYTPTRGNRYVMAGAVSQLNGLVQISVASSSLILDRGFVAEPVAVTATAPAFNTNGIGYQSRVVTISNLSYVSGTWATNQTVILQDASNNQVQVRIQSSSTATSAPSYPVALKGIAGQYDTSSPYDTGFQLQPRDQADAPVSQPTITSSLTAAATQGQAFSYQITTDNNPAATSYSASPLPTGLSVSTTTGAITGAPSESGVFNVTISATNAGGTDIKTLVITVAASGSTFTSWAGGAPLNSANLELYAIGGATSPTATDGVPSQTALTSSNLSIIAIVRTNDPNLTVFGQATANLKNGPWTTNGVTKTNAPDQLSVPSGTARQIFSIERGTNTSLFLRIDSILQP